MTIEVIMAIALPIALTLVVAAVISHLGAVARINIEICRELGSIAHQLYKIDKALNDYLRKK